MVDIIEFILSMSNGFFPVIRTIVVVIAFLVVYNLAISLVKKALLIRAKKKKQISNIEIFSRIAQYAGLAVVVLFAILSYAGSWTGLGVAAGLMTAALGWALQRPITGVAGWIMIVLKRPFDIGDRIIVAGVRGDVSDIGLTHIYLKEVGGISNSEENSGRIIMIPNSILFEQVITNYTMEDDFILDEVIVSVTYNSDLNKAIKIGEDSVRKVLRDYNEEKNINPYVRTYFHASGVNLHVRYHASAKERQKISSEITQEIFKLFKKEKNVNFAYPHVEVKGILPRV